MLRSAPPLEEEEEPGDGSSAPLPGASPAGEPAPHSTTGSVGFADTGAKLTAATTASKGARKLLSASERHRIGRIKSPAGNFYPPLPSGIDTSIPNISTSARRTTLCSLAAEPRSRKCLTSRRVCLQIARGRGSWMLTVTRAARSPRMRYAHTCLNSPLLESKCQNFTLTDSLFSVFLAAGRVRAKARIAVEQERRTAGLPRDGRRAKRPRRTAFDQFSRVCPLVGTAPDLTATNSNEETERPLS
eukprot:COSAG03_NODE_4404_length_1564_cov_1.001365_2_plen_245_part_00